MDISKCAGEATIANDQVVVCPKRDTCLRYTAKPSYYQSWMLVLQEDFGDKCESYLDNKISKLTYEEQIYMLKKYYDEEYFDYKLIQDLKKK